ncbi:MAG: P-II family nitrogen regulator [Candidatus Cyclobacteriaceae bacterium M3_2C_046]
MKKVEAIIRTSKFEEVHEALANAGIKFMSFYEVKGFGMETGMSQSYRGAAYDIGYIPRTKIEIVVSDSFLQPTIDILLKIAPTGPNGSIGDGKIFVYDLEKVYRIRNGEEGSAAIN